MHARRRWGSIVIGVHPEQSTKTLLPPRHKPRNSPALLIMCVTSIDRVVSNLCHGRATLLPHCRGSVRRRIAVQLHVSPGLLSSFSSWPRFAASCPNGCSVHGECDWCTLSLILFLSLLVYAFCPRYRKGSCVYFSESIFRAIHGRH